MFKQNPNILFFLTVKWMHHSPPMMLNSYLIKGERPSLWQRLARILRY